MNFKQPRKFPVARFNLHAQFAFAFTILPCTIYITTHKVRERGEKQGEWCKKEKTRQKKKLNKTQNGKEEEVERIKIKKET